ncbi:MAG: glutaredoxin family protein [Dehalococcoidia bacterium]|jgi:thiol-disulfide isomerase/thioredoxin|uniref:Glutaredoxin family protein n=1 Tax=Tepidiforma bonchosmolovskayae TaxID=2601677 RepID=A0ABX6C385_9CHLR|nr:MULTISPECIES: glutaredoxin family protein [Tepidiforma]MCL6644902.1 glutaredoxin family protein [Dehalococcoidia bacterium]QFG03123.1 glutaredoxin family protein [Tepidiforma bonchosmolovskayae]GIW14764.1 MAG: hypothetical protein KatS3mg063_0617 [Tepidiforma sp.]
MPGLLAVTLYRAPGCGLCDRAEAILARLARELPIAVTAVDISSDPALEARYFLEIPVIEADGRIIARAPIAEAALRAELEALLESPAR